MHNFYVDFLYLLKALPLWVVYLYVFVIGTIIGSLLNVCIYRIPRNQSIVRPRSRCPGCGSTIRWYYNIPILSYILLRGQCASCGARISPLYPFVEFLTGLYLALLFRYYGPYPPFVIYAVFGCMTIALIFIDAYHRLLPHVITMPGVIVGFAASFVNPAVRPLESGIGILIGALIPAFIYFTYKLVRKKEGMGHGDIIFLAMVGAFLGWQVVFLVILFSSMLGAVAGGVYIAVAKKDSGYMLPFGSFIGAVALVAVFFGRWALRFLFPLLRL